MNVKNVNIAQKPLVSVVLVSYNTRDLTVKSIQSIMNSSGFAKDDVEIIVVDNNSHDDTIPYLQKKLPQIRIVANKVNKGFGGGNNQGVAVARGAYILFLNTDAFLEKNTLRSLVTILAQDPQILSAGPQLRNSDGSVQASAGFAPTPMRVIAWMWWLDKLPLIKKLFPTPYHIYDIEWYKKSQKPDWLMGACVLFRRDEFVSSGGFDENIFMYAEEVELYTRLRHTYPDHHNILTTQVFATHTGSASTKKANAHRLTLELKGIEYIYRKHWPGVYWLIKLVIMVGVSMRLALYSFIPARYSEVIEYKKYFAK